METAFFFSTNYYARWKINSIKHVIWKWIMFILSSSWSIMNFWNIMYVCLIIQWWFSYWLFLTKECETGVSTYSQSWVVCFSCVCMCLVHTGNYHHDDICRNVTSRLVYVCMQSTTVLNYKKERAIWYLIFFFDHHRSALIIIFL